MKDYIELDTTPIFENCAQMGFDGYLKLATIESNLFISQLKRTLIHDKVDIIKSSYPTDYGNSIIVKIVYDEDDLDAEKQAFEIENNLPQFWDNISEEELIKLDYFKLLEKNS